MKKLIYSFVFALLTTGCIVNEDPEPTNSSLLVSRGDIVAVSYNTDSLVVFDSNGTVKRVLYTLPAAADTIGGIAWLADTNEILVAIEGTPDRVEAISVVTGTSRTFYNNVTYFTGTIMGVAQLKTSTDVIVSESATIERFTARGIRRTSAVWPTAVHTANSQLVGLSTGNWLSCSTGGQTRIYPDSMTALGLVASVAGPAGATTGQGCNELSNGTIIVSWAGAAADYIYSYDSALGTATAIVNNIQSTFQDPRGVAVGEHDEIYIADGTRNMIVQLDSTGTVIREFGNSVLSNPRHLIVIPHLN